MGTLGISVSDEELNMSIYVFPLVDSLWMENLESLLEFKSCLVILDNC